MRCHASDNLEKEEFLFIVSIIFRIPYNDFFLNGNLQKETEF
jgi:hypothetical protein